jgi:hypothetical protein
LSFLHFYIFWFCCREPENIYSLFIFVLVCLLFRSSIKRASEIVSVGVGGVHGTGIWIAEGLLNINTKK